MPFTLIKGKFHIKGYAPDGDSLRFSPDDHNNWKKLDGPKVKLNKRRHHAQLRFEGIDALETHYRARTIHQPAEFAHVATEQVIAAAGITNVVWSATHHEVVDARDGTPGYILARRTEQFGRPISFVFAGRTSKRDGSSVYLDIPWLKDSINYQLLKAGMAFPTYYTGLFWDLRDAMTEAVINAWNADKGIWPYDWTTVGVPVADMSSIVDEYVVMPKLFRRLIMHLRKYKSVAGFKIAMAANPEPIHVLSTGHFTNFDSVIEQNGNVVRLTTDPENLVFLD